MSRPNLVYKTPDEMREFAELKTSADSYARDEAIYKKIRFHPVTKKWDYANVAKAIDEMYADVARSALNATPWAGKGPQKPLLFSLVGNKEIDMDEKIKILDLLLRHGANPNKKWNDETPLTWAAALSEKYDMTRVFESLLKEGADPLFVDSSQSTALDTVARYGAPEHKASMIQMLERWMSNVDAFGRKVRGYETRGMTV